MHPKPKPVLNAMKADPYAGQKPPLYFVACSSAEQNESCAIGYLVEKCQVVFKSTPLTSTQVLDDNVVRFFSTNNRDFVVADLRGDEDLTRSIVRAASTADLALIVVDARHGVLPRNRIHTFLISLLGITQVVLVIDNIDLAGFSRQTFADVANGYRESAKKVGIVEVQSFPVSAKGDNVVELSPNTEWYDGPSLLRFLESVPLLHKPANRPFRMAVASEVVDQQLRTFAGLIATGEVQRGDAVRVLPSGHVSCVDRIVLSGQDVDQAVAGQSITLTLKDNIHISVGDVLAAAASVPPAIADQFEATVIWMHKTPMLPGRTYDMKIGARTVSATVAPLKYRINIDSLERAAAETLERDEIGVVEIELDRQIVFEPYRENHALGGFTLIDKLSSQVVGFGLLHFALRRAENIHWQAVDVSKDVRARLKHQEPCILWFTGLSAAGKSTIANLVEKQLVAMQRHTYLLDGDNVRRGLNKDLGFTAQDRVENIRRVGEVAKLMVDAGLIVLASFISPFRNERRMVRDLMKPLEFIEVFIDTPLSVAEQRDPKGLYKKARRGELKNFTGIDSPYEAPERPDIRIDTTAVSAEAAASEIIELLISREILEIS